MRPLLALVIHLLNVGDGLVPVEVHSLGGHLDAEFQGRDNPGSQDRRASREKQMTRVAVIHHFSGTNLFRQGGLDESQVNVLLVFVAVQEGRGFSSASFSTSGGGHDLLLDKFCIDSLLRSAIP